MHVPVRAKASLYGKHGRALRSVIDESRDDVLLGIVLRRWRSRRDWPCG